MSEDFGLFPVMECETNIMNTLKKLRESQVIQFDPEFKKQMVWDLIECLYPTDMTDAAKKQMKSLKSNHSSQFDRTTKEPIKAHGVLIHMVWNIFMNGIWWDTHAHGESKEYFDGLSETAKFHKSIARKLRSVKQEIRHLESENERIMEEKGFITQHELEKELADQKEKHNEQMDNKYREDRKAFVALQKQVADYKRNANYFEDIVDKQRTKIEYLEKENVELIRQLSMKPAPDPQPS